MRSDNPRQPRFRDKAIEEYRYRDSNPYMVQHKEMGPPVVTASEAPPFRGRWAEAFGREAPLHVEIGSGNGFFLSGFAALHPEWNLLGVEIRFKRVMLCAQKIKKAGLPHARIARYDAWWLDDVFALGEIEGLYIHFPDPWARASEHKKRLLAPPFAAWAARAMAVGAPLRLKSDHLPNLDRLLAAMDGLPFEVVGRTEDVEKTGYPWESGDDIITNYQSKFMRRGLPSHALLLRRVAGEAPEAPAEREGQPAHGDSVEDEEDEG